MNFLSQINRWFNPWRRRILLMVGKAIITAVKDSDKLQVVQVSLMKDELKGDVERIQEFGFTSNPPVNSEAVAVCIGGDRSNMIIIGTDSSEHRLKSLAAGESALYNSVGSYMKARSNKKMHIKSGVYDCDTDVIINAILNHTHLGNNGVATSNPQASPVPTLPADFQQGET